MRELVSVELNKALKNPWFYIAVLIGCSLAVASAYMAIQSNYSAGLSGREDEWLGTGATGVFAAWMLVGTGDLFVSGVFFYILPLLTLIPYCWSLQTEIFSGALAHEYTCRTRRDTLAARYIAVFISSGAAAVIPLLVNLVILMCFVPASVPEVTSNIYMGMREEEIWVNLYFTWPALYVAVNVVYDFVLAGIWGGLVLSMSTVLENRVVLLVGSYVAALAIDFVNNYLFFILNINGFTFSLLRLLHAGQAGFRTAGPMVAVPLAMAAVSALLLRRFKRKDLL